MIVWQNPLRNDSTRLFLLFGRILRRRMFLKLFDRWICLLKLNNPMQRRLFNLLQRKLVVGKHEVQRRPRKCKSNLKRRCERWCPYINPLLILDVGILEEEREGRTRSQKES